MACIELEWWAYLSVVFSFFVLCLLLNYVVKKINEAKIEERFIRMLQKASTTQSTQVNGPLIAVETAKTPHQASPPGISLVFNQEENRRRTDPYNMILKPPKDTKFEVPPLNAYKSIETINLISIPSDDRTVTISIPVKKFESERVAAKATSSQKLTEKVPVKNNEFGRRAVKVSSVTNTTEGYVTERLSLKNNEYEHVPVIDTLPVNRKDCDTSDLSNLVSENEAGRIISRKSSTSIIHIGNVIQDVTAKETAERRESDRIKAEGTTSNEPNDSVAENVPLTNNCDGRMFTTNASYIVEVTAKKPTVLGEKTSKEDIHSGCFIKKSVDSILTKIVNLTNKNEDLRREKSVTDTYVVKQASTVTETSRNIKGISYVETKESSSIAAKETSSYAQSDRVGQSFTVKKREETSLHARIEHHVKDFFALKMNVTTNATKANPIRTQSDITVSRYFPIKRSESGSFTTKGKDSLLLLSETSHTRSDDNVAKSLVNMSESSRISVNVKSLTEIVLEKNKEDTESEILVRKTEDSTVVAESADTSKTMNDDPVNEIPFPDKIMALIHDEDVIDIMINKPSSSTKK